MNRPEEKHIEDTIDQTLAGLRDTPIPQDLETRLLRSLEDSAIARPHARSLANLTWRTAAACGLTAIAAAALIAILMPATHRNLLKPQASILKVPKKSLESPGHAATTPNVATVERLKPARPHTRGALLAASAHAESANRHVNLPPPPLPLTRDERMLLVIAHRRPPVELAMLTPAQRVAREQRERKEFDQFFAPSESEIKIEKFNNSQLSAQGKL